MVTNGDFYGALFLYSPCFSKCIIFASSVWYRSTEPSNRNQAKIFLSLHPLECWERSLGSRKESVFTISSQRRNTCPHQSPSFEF